jgi:hypothetical protein
MKRPIMNFLIRLIPQSVGVLLPEAMTNVRKGYNPDYIKEAVKVFENYPKR